MPDNRRTKPRMLSRPPRARVAMSASAPFRRLPLDSCARSMGFAPVHAPADLDVQRHVELHRRLGGVAMTCLITAAAASSRPRAPRTPVRRGPGAASGRRRPASISAPPIRAIARLMRSALVPWIGALIAARSAPPRIDGLGERMLGWKWLPAEQGFGEAMLAGEASVLCEKSADAGKALVIAVDDRLAFVLRQAEPSSNAPGRASVEDGEVDRLGLVSSVAVDCAEKFFGSDRVNVFARPERFFQLGDVGHVRGEPKLDLAIVGGEDLLPARRRKRRGSCGRARSGSGCSGGSGRSTTAARSARRSAKSWCGLGRSRH